MTSLQDLFCNFYRFHGKNIFLSSQKLQQSSFQRVKKRKSHWRDFVFYFTYRRPHINPSESKNFKQQSNDCALRWDALHARGPPPSPTESYKSRLPRSRLVFYFALFGGHLENLPLTSHVHAVLNGCCTLLNIYVYRIPFVIKTKYERAKKLVRLA